jgi:hypothetical protein
MTFGAANVVNSGGQLNFYGGEHAQYPGYCILKYGDYGKTSGGIAAQCQFRYEYNGASNVVAWFDSVGKFGINGLTANAFVGTDAGKQLSSLSGATATSMLENVVGDTGAGGTKGLVPAPAAGDAAAEKFLKADGTWAAITDGALSANVPLKNAANTFSTGTQTIQTGGDATKGLIVNGTAGQSVNLQEWQKNGTAVVVVDGDGKVGIGMNPSYKLDVNGEVRCTSGVWVTSDYRLKQNVAQLTNSIDRVMHLKPCQYNLKDTPNRIDEGFLAHEVQEVIPAAVLGDKDVVDATGKMLPQVVNYCEVIPSLTGAIQELKRENDALKTQNQKLCDVINALLKRVEAIEGAQKPVHPALQRQ